MNRRYFISTIAPALVLPSLLITKRQSPFPKLLQGECYQTHIDYIVPDRMMPLTAAVKRLEASIVDVIKYYDSWALEGGIGYENNFDNILNSSARKMYFVDSIPEALDLQKIKEHAAERGQTVVFTQFGTTSISVNVSSDRKYSSSLPMYLEPLGFSYPRKNRLEWQMIRLLRNTWMSGTIYFIIDGRTNEVEVRIHNPETPTMNDLTQSFDKCISKMKPGILYLNRIRIDYKTGWEYPKIRPSNEAFDIANHLVKASINVLAKRLENTTIVLEKPFVDDSVAEDLIARISQKSVATYSPEIIWTWSDIPNRQPQPERCVGGWLDRLGYIEWNYVPALNASGVMSLTLVHPPRM